MNRKRFKGRGGWHVPQTGGGEMLWSDPSTWGGSVPTTNDPVTVAAGDTIILDTDTASLASLTIEGILKTVGNDNVSITAGHVVIEGTGTLQIGTESTPYTGVASITLTGAEASRANRFVADDTSSGGTGNGRLKRLFVSTGAVAEVITITWSSASAFTVSGSVSGALSAGTTGVAYNDKIRFIPTAGSTAWASGATRVVTVVQRGFTNSGTPRSLQKEAGGVLSLVGNPPAVVRTRLNANLAAAGSTLTVADAVTWANGSQIIIGPTDYLDQASGDAESATLGSASSASTTVTLSGGVTAAKYGVMQYVTDAGMSLTADTLTNNGSGSSGVAMSTDDWNATPKTLDERAMVVHMTRNIVVQGVDDSAWSSSKFGGHCMFMGLSGQVKLHGVEFKRMGQAGAIGRYPIHWHTLSYDTPDGMTLPSDGTFLGATNNSDNYIKKCSINVASNRAIVIHATHGVLVQDNNCFDITGHAVFLEDGSEKVNTIDRNVVMQVGSPTSANKLLDHDIIDAFAGNAGTSCYWLPNPNNTITDNWGTGTFVGMWNSFAAPNPWGLSREVAEVPRTTAVIEHSGNIMACHQHRGFMTEGPQSDNKGSNSVTFFAGVVGVDGMRYTFIGNQAWKNALGGYLNRANAPGLYDQWVMADNNRVDFSGQVDHDVTLNRTLLVAVSLNAGPVGETRATNGRKAAFVSYDEGFVPKNIIAVNYELREPPTSTRDDYSGQSPNIQGGGLLRMGEYITPQWSFTYSEKWKLIDCIGGYMCPPPHIDGLGSIGANQKFTLGICRDVNGLFTGTPNTSIVWDDTFYTTDAAGLASFGAWGQTTSSLYMGLDHSVVSGIDADGSDSLFYMERQNSGGSVVGVWEVPDSSASPGNGLSPFKHCALMRGGIYKAHWSGSYPSGTNAHVVFRLSWFRTSSDTCTLGVAWSNSKTIGTIYLRWAADGFGGTDGDITAGELVTTFGGLPYAIKATNTSMTSRADVIAASTFKYWQDTTNNVVWIKLVGGIVADLLGTHTGGLGILNPGREIGLAIREQVVP